MRTRNNPIIGGAPVFKCDPVMPRNEDVQRLQAAGFQPVIRWVDLSDPSGATLKTIEALTLLDRREEKARG